MDDFFPRLNAVVHEIEAFHDSFTKLHEVRVGELMLILSQELGLSPDYCMHLKEVGSLHDIGKIALPAEILGKRGPLSEYERETIKLHAQIGHSFFQKVSHPLKDLAAIVAVSHHEAYDGSGYPKGLKGKEIPLPGRICSICDVYDALRSYRPYHESECSHEEALKQMQNKSSEGLANKFDPVFLEAFVQAAKKFLPLYEQS